MYMLKNKVKKGQAVIIVLLVLVVVLTIGLSVATNTVRDIKLSQQTELSNRAFNAAEAGIEAALSGDVTSGNVTVGSGTTQSTYNVSVTTQGGVAGEAFIFNKPVTKDDTQQIWFIKHNDDGTLNESDATNFKKNKLSIYWGNNGTASNADTTPAVEVTFIYKVKATGEFKMAKGFFDPNSNRTSTNNFQLADSGDFLTPTVFEFKKDLDLSQAPFNVSGIEGASPTVIPYALRLRLMYNDKSHILGVKPATNDSSFPVQGRLITSTGQADNLTRRVDVFDSFPALPPIFDYVIFNGSNNSLQK